ncbi:acetyl-CoA carboxylase biotin carboxylase subunit family protein [Bradyrhizobium sp. 18]|uniref:ATP-grasp domain-containing protein n=1 Tax=Bradyrhizobium sp. 18 TaxID=2782657 RepID=UPI001FFB3ABF|nr:acetyl-CoA carboxylase biotin carboxylase subunit family protein [Bradyrhizobium sp. 18]MCK1506880.1 acetyl-CoA carboxylase biotin carboxylase subunit family protein [Bradyrhizobium sp. 18]
MPRTALILLEGASNGPMYIQAAQRLGLHPITLSTDPTQYAYLAASGCEAICVDTGNLNAMIHECSKLRRTFDIAGITSALESAYAAVGKLCLYFDLPGPNPAAVEKCRDKFTQRQLLAAAGIPLPAYRLAANATDVESSAAQIGLPVVVKPAFGIGSSGVRLCRNVDELAEHTAYLLGEEYKWRSSPRILVEEFAQGSHYSVEVMGNEVVGIGAADFGGPPHFICREYIYPALLTDDEHRLIADVSLGCLHPLGLGWGPANVDLRWTTLGPVVIEVNPRLAGTPNPQLLRLAYGIDLINEHIKLVTGRKCDLRRRHSHIAAARILIPDRDGILDAISGHSQAAAVPGVTEVKCSIEPQTSIVRKGDYRDKIGHVIAAAPTLAQTEAILQRAVDFINWSITPFPALTEQQQHSGLLTSSSDANGDS